MKLERTLALNSHSFSDSLPFLQGEIRGATFYLLHNIFLTFCVVVVSFRWSSASSEIHLRNDIIKSTHKVLGLILHFIWRCIKCGKSNKRKAHDSLFATDTKTNALRTLHIKAVYNVGLVVFKTFFLASK